VYNDPDGMYGTVVYWMDRFLIDCEARVAAGTLSQRTYDDYAHAIVAPALKADGKLNAAGALRTWFAPPMTPLDVTPNMVKNFLQTHATLGRGVQANREKACFSAFLSWLSVTGEVPGLMVNPCMRASGVKRNPETKRERYVSHDEYREIYAVATRAERLMMELTYRTLQRPESDVILWNTTIVTTEGGRRKLVFQQNKTGTSMQIWFSQAMEELVYRPEGKVRQLRAPLVATLKGEHYTYTGLASMLRRSIEVANERRRVRGAAPMESYGYRDLKVKGATDMYFIDQVPLEQIQQLLGHASKTTTEIYVKARWRVTSEPNQVVMG
jgi:integrase